MLREFSDRWGWAESLKVCLVLSRGVLGLFVSGMLGFGLYVLMLPLALSIWGYGNSASLIMLLVFSTGIGAGIGGYLTWFERDFRAGMHAALFAVAVGCALVGAWLGLLRGIEVGALHPIWKPGFPMISVATMGAVISANLPLLAFALYRTIRDPRL